MRLANNAEKDPFNTGKNRLPCSYIAIINFNKNYSRQAIISMLMVFRINYEEPHQTDYSTESLNVR